MFSDKAFGESKQEGRPSRGGLLFVCLESHIVVWADRGRTNHVDNSFQCRYIVPMTENKAPVRRRFTKYVQGSTWRNPSPLYLTMGAGKDAIQLKHYNVKNPDAPRCCCDITDHFTSTQCMSPGKEQDENGDWWCGRHSPSKEAADDVKRKAKDAERHAQWERERAARKAKEDAVLLLPKYEAALQAIAAGHNNAIGLAREVLGLETPEEERY